MTAPADDGEGWMKVYGAVSDRVSGTTGALNYVKIQTDTSTSALFGTASVSDEKGSHFRRCCVGLLEITFTASDVRGRGCWIGNRAIFGLDSFRLSARIVTRTHREEKSHSAGGLSDLHWLPVKGRIPYKILQQERAETLIDNISHYMYIFLF